MIENFPNIWEELSFYLVILSVVVIWGVWRCVAHWKLNQVHKGRITKFENKDEQNYDQSERNFTKSIDTYNLIYTIQKRAFNSRTAAHLLFGFVIFLLFIGIHAIIFGLPLIEFYDATKEIEIRERISKDLIESDLGDEIKAMIEGRYWFRISNPIFDKDGAISSSDTERLKGEKPSNGSNTGSIATLHYDDTFIFSQNCGQSWEEVGVKMTEGERVVNSYFGTDGQTIIIGGDKRTVLVSGNGGQSWDHFSNRLKDSEVVNDVSFSADGKIGFIGSDEGSEFVTLDGGKSWIDFSDRLEARDYFIDLSFNADGKKGVIVSNEGFVFFTRNGGQSWTNSSVSLKEDETVMNSTFNADRMTGAIVGDKGSVFATRNAGQSWINSSVNLKENEFARELIQGKFILFSSRLVGRDSGHIFLFI